MLKIPCPYCGPREETEFAHGGEAHRRRPDPSADDTAWNGWFYARDNPKGWTRERWRHSGGCGRWFYLCRETAANRVGPAYAVGAPPPPFPEDGAGR